MAYTPSRKSGWGVGGALISKRGYPYSPPPNYSGGSKKFERSSPLS
jgi:hypothetical protein